jgi:predicted DNA-binding transcriptional regulator AlpA
LITLKQIEQEHGVSRSALHMYRRSTSFPRPAPVEGSTKIVYRADEVASWFEANPPQQGRRTDLASSDEGAAMPQTTEQPAGKPDYLTEEQWTGLVMSVLTGVGEGCQKAGLGMEPELLVDLGAAAMDGLRVRLDERMEEASDG